jgi:hypothetical protein
LGTVAVFMATLPYTVVAKPRMEAEHLISSVSETILPTIVGKLITAVSLIALTLGGFSHSLHV